MPIELLAKFRDATQHAYEAQRDSKILWRLAEMDRALGNLAAAGEEYSRFFADHPEDERARCLTALMTGDFSYAATPKDATAPFVLVHNVVSDEEFQQVREGVERRREKFAPAEIGANETARVDPEIRSALASRGNRKLQDLTRPLYERLLKEHDVLRRLGLNPVSTGNFEIQPIAYGTGGKYIVHRDSESAEDARILTSVWFIHEEPKSFTGGDLLLHDEPPLGEGFTRIVPQRNTAVFFPSYYLHEVTPVLTSMASDPLGGRLVLNTWFHRLD